MHPLVHPVLTWFATEARDLPWRAQDRTPWGVLVSEVMLQQTPVRRVEPLWREWMARWPDAPALAAAGTADVLRAWGGLGYPRRALRLQECARVVVTRHGGSLPTSAPELLALPGIGTYTAAAVLAFAYGRHAVVVDTNVRRVLARAVDGGALPPPHLGTAEMRRAAEVVPGDDATASAWNAAVMELGALVCTARAPDCSRCPVEAMCAWRAAGNPAGTVVPRRQAWHGTDRQVRGRIMSALRAAPGPLPVSAVASDWPDHEQRARAVSGLVADGLLVHDDAAGTYSLPA